MSRVSVPDDERGMILVNVLLFVAIASGMVMLMINREELALDRALRTREAARALSVVRGGETSAIVALRRDARQAGDVDHRGEAWAALSENGAPIEGGTFDLVIADAQGRFNINNVMSPRTADKVMFRNIARAAGLTDDQILAAAALVKQYGPVTDLQPLRMAGIDPAVADKLERLVTALPGHSEINLNAATPEMLGVLFHDPIVVDRMVSLRTNRGFLTKKDIADLDQAVPPGTGFRSSTFWVRVRATIGETTQQEASLIQRAKTPDGDIRVAAVERWRNASVPPEAPLFAPPS
ncbi:general secretion pathway protein GspK [Stakelama marina]|uniref:Type II secretion system protein K n=1 Tax=Stakelama marina TaxID=2826939 RepID=A0A8T4I9K9_9SPHN|nr:type II secretion system protein GspK [Stakelama marina]MBR0551033.1 general secretion pathway protein GspK [Stakelama marina]